MSVTDAPTPLNDGEIVFLRDGKVTDHFPVSTLNERWLEDALDALLCREDVALYDHPTRRCITIRTRWFDERKPLLPALRRILRDDFGIVAGKGGRLR